MRGERNFIKELLVEGGRVIRDGEPISEKVSRFYRELYKEDVTHRPFLESLDWAPLDSTKVSWLKRPFEEEEVRGVMRLS